MLSVKISRDLRSCAGIAAELSKSSIRHVENLWSSERIEFFITPQQQAVNHNVLEVIIMWSFELYLRRPGHVSLPNGMITALELEQEQNNSLLRVRMLWEYWHGSRALDGRRTRVVNTMLDHFLTERRTHQALAP